MSKIIRNWILKQWDKAKVQDEALLASQKPIQGITMVSDLPYLDDGNPKHLLNVYYPADTISALPLVVNIHGGGWMYGDKSYNRNYCMSLASYGFSVMGMSYRLLPETNLRGQIQDIFASLHWLREHVSENLYHYDLNNVFLTGDSAGGHLAGIVVCVQLSNALQKIYGVEPLPFEIKGLVGNHGVYGGNMEGFLKGMFARMLNHELDLMMYGKYPKKAAWYGRSAFEDTAVGLEIPPVFLVSSETDPFNVQTFAMKDYLAKRNAQCEFKFWKREQGEKLGHVFHVKYPEWPESIETNREVAEFIKRIVLANKSAPKLFT
jgi:acetyl esterase/lipase